MIAYPRDDVVVLGNFANRSYPAYRIGLPRARVWKVRLSTDARAYGEENGGAEAVTATPGARDGLENEAYPARRLLRRDSLARLSRGHRSPATSGGGGICAIEPRARGSATPGCGPPEAFRHSAGLWQ